MRIQHPFARTLITVRTWPVVIDLGVALCGLAVFFGIIHMARYWMGAAAPVVPISHSLRALPLYLRGADVRIGWETRAPASPGASEVVRTEDEVGRTIGEADTFDSSSGNDLVVNEVGVDERPFVEREGVAGA